MLRLATLALIALPFAVHAEDVTVFAAASMKTALDEIAASYTADNVVISYAGSSQLAKQIEAGAPADMFISASEDWMDAVEADVVPGTRRDLLGNVLVVVGAKDAAPLEISALPETLGEEKLAMALVDSVPAGVYGKEALTTLGLWDALAPHVAQADNVRAALALVATGEAPFGIVYASDAVAEPNVTPVATFPADSHAPITYPVALIGTEAKPAAQAFLDHLSSPEAQAILESQGFEVLD